MKFKLFLLGGVGLSLGLVAACHDNNSPSSSIAQPQSLDTAQVLALARNTSESSAPIAVDGGAITLNDTSESSAPIAVD